MDRYSLILSYGNLSKSIKDLNWGRDEKLSEELSSSRAYQHESSLLSLLTAGYKQFISYCDLDSLQNNWTIGNQGWVEISSNSVNEGLDDFCLVAHLLNHFNGSNFNSNIERPESKGLEDPIDYLHQLADRLPILGSYIIEVVIITSVADFPPPEEFIAFYGFLERLQLWHQARINILDVDEISKAETENVTTRPQLSAWNDVIDLGRVRRNGFSLSIRSSILWNGCLCLRDENGCHSRISGLELRTDPCINSCKSQRVESSDPLSTLLLSDEIEVLKVIEDYDVPLHAYCHTQLKLTLKQGCDESSKYFFNAVQQAKDESLCLLGSIPYNEIDVDTDTAALVPDTRNWLEYASDKKTEYFVPCDLKTQLPRRCVIIIRGSCEADSLDVLFVKDGRNFCGSGLLDFLSYEHSSSKQKERSLIQVDWKLPLISDEDIFQAQIDRLENLSDTLEACNSSEAPKRSFQEDDIASVFAKSSKFVCFGSDDTDVGDDECELEYCAATLISPSQWPERLAWCNQEISASMSLRGSLKRFQSAENHMKLKGIPVSAEKMCQDVGETFSQVLELFDATGRPFCRDLKSIPLVADRLFKQLPSEVTVKVLPFSKAKQFVGHGIDYCLDSHNSLKLDAKLVRIQERFIANDTRCSWSQRPKISPKAVHGPHHEEGRIHKSRNEREVKISKSSSDKKPGAKDRDAEMIGNSRRKSVHAPATKREKKLKNCSKEVDAANEKGSKETRSQRHQRRLKVICEATLQKYGLLQKDDPIFERCLTRLFSLCKSFLKDLKTSEGLVNEMKRLAKLNVNQVVDFERRGR